MIRPCQSLQGNLRQRWALLLVATLIVANGCAVNPVSGVGDFVLITEAQEVSIGAEEHAKVIAEYGVYADARLQSYVEGVGKQLAKQSHRGHLTFHFTLLDSPEVNAFALPGGYIYITRGLLVYLNSEEQLAAVIGHEIGHVTARHGVRQMSASQATSVGMTLGAILLPELGMAGVSDALGLLGNALIRGYGRDHELEADRLGAEYLARSGYDSDAMIDVIRVLKNQELFDRQQAGEEGRAPRSYHGLFATHPDNDTRLQQVVAEAKRLDSRPVTRQPDREAFLRLGEGMVFGTGVRQGRMREGTFYHPALDLAITFPAGWQVDNLSDRVVVSEAENRAQMVLKIGNYNGQLPLREALLATYPMAAMEQGRRLTLRGFEGYTGVGWLQGRAGRLRGRVAILVKGAEAYFIAAVAVDEVHYRRYERMMLAAIESLHTLTPQERRLAEPLRIVVRAAHDGENYRLLARQSPLPHHAESQLRLLNGHYPKGELKPHQLFKLVR